MLAGIFVIYACFGFMKLSGPIVLSNLTIFFHFLWNHEILVDVVFCQNTQNILAFTAGWEIFSHFAVEVFVVLSVRNRLGLHPESRLRRRFDLFCKNLLEVSIRSEVKIEVTANCFADIWQNIVSNWMRE